MNQNLIKALHFLRTTDLPQARNRIYDRGACCALGAMIYAIEGPPDRPERRGFQAWTKYATATPYTDLAVDLGLSCPLLVSNITDWNDHSRLTFPEIADRIEASCR